MGIVDIIDKQADLFSYAGPGHWNDPDMLEVGNAGLTFDENITHFSMWAMLSAPLMAGNDLRNMPRDVKEILTNKEVIALNQDKLGNQAFKFLDMGDKEIWVKFLENNELAICFLNRSEFTWKEDYNWARLNIYHEDKAIRFGKQEYKFYNVWNKKYTGTTKDFLDLQIPSHGVLLLRLKPIS